MSVKSLVKQQHRGPCLRLITSFNYDKDEHSDFVTKEFQIDNLAVVRFTYNHNYSFIESSISAKKLDTLPFSVEITVSSELLNCSKQLQLHNDDWTEWMYLGKYINEFCNDDVLLYLLQVDIMARKVVMSSNVHAKIYDDDTFIDFRLSAADGSVGVHKVFLAAHSDVFSRMLQGKWKETAEGCVELEGVTQQNLQHLKDYLYLGALPEDGLQPLLLLARYFMIEDLKVECTRKLVKTATADNLHALLEFACENNIPELAFGILHMTPDETVNSAYTKNLTKLLL